MLTVLVSGFLLVRFDLLGEG